MSLIGYISSLLLEILLLCRVAESQKPTIAKAPNSTVYAVEGKRLTLTWMYNLNGHSFQLMQFTPQGLDISYVVRKFLAEDPNIDASYAGRITATVTDTSTSITFLVVNRTDSRTYKFDVQTSQGGTPREVVIEVWVPAKLTKLSPDLNVPEGSNLQLVCEATGKPDPDISWTRVFKNGSESEVLHSKTSWNITNINRTESGTYRCTANNGVANSVSRTLKVNVLYPPKIVDLPTEYKAALQQSVSLQCKADGNPQPSFTWTPCDPQEYVCSNSSLNILEVLDDAVYTCKVANSQGDDSANTSIVIAGDLINVTLVITSESCSDGKYNQSVLSKKLNEVMSQLFNESIYRSTTVRSVRCGSLTVDLTLAYSTIVTEKWVLSILREAAKDGKLGEFSVDDSSIKGTRPVVVTTTTPPISKTTPSVSDDKTWIIVGAVLGSLAAVAVIAGVAFWCVRKKKKNGGKGTKEVGDDDTAGQGQYMRQGPSSAGDGLNNSGYVDAGSASNYANPSGLPPMKPGSKKENKQEKKGKKEVKQKETNQQQALPLYAQVDKSKKTPKAPVNTYDQVERSRKSQPGEVMYTQVEQVNPGGSMPRAAASPVRRPPAYDDTQYAELII